MTMSGAIHHSPPPQDTTVLSHLHLQLQLMVSHSIQKQQLQRQLAAVGGKHRAASKQRIMQEPVMQLWQAHLQSRPGSATVEKSM